MRTHLDAEALRQWAALALDGMRRHRRDIDALNVFPVPDGDTGTNMYLTLEAGVEAMLTVDGTAVDEGGTERLAALARGMLLGARGNSGVIASELMRGIAAARASDLARPLDGGWLADALDKAASAAFGAVAEPKEGTVLTVARAAADAALACAADTGGDLQGVTAAAASAARDALAETPNQLEALRRAGVVDAGGRGYVVLTDALLEVVTGVHRELPEFPRRAPEPDSLASPADLVHGYGGPAYEVMFLLDAPDAAVPPLRQRLAALGDSLVVVGGDGLWNVHVHVDDAGAAVEAALAVGAPHRIRITYLADVVGAGHQQPTGRALVVVAHGQGVADLLEASGVTVVRAPELGRPSMQEFLDGIQATGATEVVLLPGDKDSRPVAESAALAARDAGHRVAVIPTRSIVQSLAAVAVHSPDEPFDDDVVNMTRASSATQYAGLTTAIREALTSAGACRVGDELGVIRGDILEIGSDCREVAVRVLTRMLARGGSELVTVVLGADAPADLLDAMQAWVAEHHPEVEVVGYEGGQPRWHAIIGVE
ncbi:MAG: DAK2 domain-containing protein [Candidatus Nanopelagicales bacterium]|jgi:DAK2 domain fusion protein YloV|nr:DAK2 domain-containing protein [Candidatus Nanopelagicales bacterium]